VIGAGDSSGLTDHATRDSLAWEELVHMPNLKYSTYNSFWNLVREVTDKDLSGNYVKQDISMFEPVFK
jgi:hypothetical protein